MTARRALLAAAAVLASACAQASPPPGGERDRLAPRVLSTSPAPLEVVPGYDQPVVIRFDERLSERNIETSVLVSPLTGDVRVERSGAELHVSLSGGWQPGQIYRVTVLPGLRDLFGNERRDVGELVFSTGPPIPNTALAGVITDRVTGRAASQAVAHALRRPDSVLFAVPADSGGFFALRNLPLGLYDIRAFADANRNRRLDPSELRSRDQAISLVGADTTLLELTLLPVDSTPARLLRADAIDSLHIRLTFDDHIEPGGGLGAVAVQLHTLPDSARSDAAFEVLLPQQYEARIAGERAARDSVRADSVRAARGDSAAAAPARPAPGADAEPAEPLPARELVVALRSPLTAGQEYAVTVHGVTNINGIGGGSGTARMRVPERPAPAPAGARPDTAAVPPPR